MPRASVLRSGAGSAVQPRATSRSAFDRSAATRVGSPSKPAMAWCTEV
ncbi:hypothetical protein ACIPSA_27490 [Streptomyces sp. NPDC086549]